MNLRETGLWMSLAVMHYTLSLNQFAHVAFGLPLDVDEEMRRRYKIAGISYELNELGHDIDLHKMFNIQRGGVYES